MTTRNSNYGDVQTSPLHDKNYDIHSQKPEDDRKLFVGNTEKALAHLSHAPRAFLSLSKGV